MIERRPHRTKFCPIPLCEWKLHTAWFEGNPHNIKRLSQEQQDAFFLAHLETHTPAQKAIYDLGSKS